MSDGVHRTTRTSSALGRNPYEVDEGAQGRRHMAPARIVEEGPGETLPPVFEHRLQRAARERRRQILLEAADHPDASDGGGYLQLHGRGDQRARRADTHDLAVTLELPGRADAAREAMAHAGVAEQILGTRRPAAPPDRRAGLPAPSGGAAGRTARRSRPAPALPPTGHPPRTPAAA